MRLALPQKKYAMLPFIAGCGACLWFYPDLRNGILAANENLIGWALGSLPPPSNSMVVLKDAAWLQWSMLAIEVVLASALAVQLIYSIFSNAGNIVSGIRARLTMLIPCIASLLMARYMLSIFFGTIRFFGVTVVSAYEQEVIYPYMTAHLGNVLGIYICCELIPLALTPVIGGGWIMLNILSSVTPIGVYVAALGFLAADWTHEYTIFRGYAFRMYATLAVFEGLNIWITANLNRRGIFGATTEEVAKSGGPH